MLLVLVLLQLKAVCVIDDQASQARVSLCSTS
jgi:hypothetical protein